MFNNDVQISTINGYVKIQDLKIGELVLTHNNTYKKILNVKNKLHQDSLFIIKILGIDDLYVTKDQLFYVRTKNGEYEWKEARSLLKGDLIVIPTINAKKTYQLKINKKYLTTPFLDKEEVNFNDYVYNVEVEEDNSYCVNNIAVHY